MTVFAVKTGVLVALKADPVWFERVKQCKSAGELQSVIVDFGKVNGFKAMEVHA